MKGMDEEKNEEGESWKEKEGNFNMAFLWDLWNQENNIIPV